MRELLEYVRKHHFLKMGDYRFSPVMEISAGISMQYCRNLNEDNCELSPLFLCFPEKHSACLWTTISILTNYYFDDYVTTQVDGINFSKGEKVKIFGCIGEIERISKVMIFLKFRDQGGIPINKRLQSHLSKVNPRRALSTKSRFSSNYFKYRNDRNPISKILVPNDPETINQNNLYSKVLLITGRGNVKVFHNLLNETELYDTPLSRIYPENKNIIIKPDLKSYKDYFDSGRLTEFSNFKDLLGRLADTVEIESAQNKLKDILEDLNISQSISEQLNEEILQFFSDYASEIPQKIDFLEKKYPGIQESLPDNLRAVVINDIQQLTDYPNTIKGFLAKKIPVIFTTNRSFEHSSNFELFQQLFGSNPKYYRINWNKNKIKDLLDLADRSEYIDKDLWRQCKRYNKQVIEITVTPSNELDELAPRLLKHIKELNDFQNLQKAFYNYYYPALYSIKNSIQLDDGIKDLIHQFKMIFDGVKRVIPKDIVEDFENSISLSLDYKNNSKSFELKEYTFVQSLPLEAKKKLFIPAGAKTVNLPTSETKKIFFSGYPYSEFTGKYLLRASCVNFVPEMEILCWPIEASLTYKYLYNRLLASYFTDNIYDLVTLDNKYLLKENDDFNEEIDSFLRLNKEIEHGDIEDNLEYIHTFRYKGYENEQMGPGTFTVKCDIINFEDGSFMFLPNGSKILAQSEDSKGILKVAKRSLRELSIGDRIFKYVKDRQAMRYMAKSNKLISNYFERLEYWKDVLERIYFQCNSDIDKVELLLKNTKRENHLDEGNPSKNNIRNWLFDDEFLKPENENLRIIFLANNEEDINNKIEILNEAYYHVVSYTIALSSQIKKQISKKLSAISVETSEITVEVQGIEILVESRIIASIDKNDIEVDYLNTRKILC